MTQRPICDDETLRYLILAFGIDLFAVAYYNPLKFREVCDIKCVISPGKSTP